MLHAAAVRRLRGRGGHQLPGAIVDVHGRISLRSRGKHDGRPFSKEFLQGPPSFNSMRLCLCLNLNQLVLHTRPQCLQFLVRLSFEFQGFLERQSLQCSGFITRFSQCLSLHAPDLLLDRLSHFVRTDSRGLGLRQQPRLLDRYFSNHPHTGRLGLGLQLLCALPHALVLLPIQLCPALLFPLRPPQRLTGILLSLRMALPLRGCDRIHIGRPR
mmetsp:Transcript_82607/g.230351  ORF Transcript_82607/g.230351 Transcript_82607/m.230351 type:complete len:214 (-) Transcript_82607:681-1322(-)